MIVQAHPIVQKLSELQHKFELTGSRFFGFQRDLRYSDWDFLCLRGNWEESQKLDADLTALGFKRVPTRDCGYEDDGAITCWRWESPEKTGPTAEASVDVLMLYDEKEYERRLRVLQMIRDFGADKLYDALHGKSAAWADLFGLIRRLERAQEVTK